MARAMAIRCCTGFGHNKPVHVVIRPEDVELVAPAQDQFVLHFLAQFQVKRTQRLVQKQDSWFIDNGAGDGDPLLLAAA